MGSKEMISLDTIKIGVGDEYKKEKLKGWTYLRMESEEFLKEKFFINLRYYQATINSRGLKVEFSFPQLVRGDNILGVSSEYLKPAIKWIERDLREKGVKTSLLRGRILRMDIFRNVETEYSFENYSEVLRSLYLKRTHRRDYVDGFLVGNTLREICFYNKVKEAKEKYGDGIIRKYKLDGERIMRGEFRVLQKVDEVLKDYPIVSVNDLCKNYKIVPVIYLEFMGKVFEREFTEGSQETEISEERIRRALIDLSVYGRDALKWYGLETYSYCNRDELKRALLEYYKKSETYKILRVIERESKKFDRFRRKKFTDLYQELKTKFLDLNGVWL